MDISFPPHIGAIFRRAQIERDISVAARGRNLTADENGASPRRRQGGGSNSLVFCAIFEQIPMDCADNRPQILPSSRARDDQNGPPNR
jgi:hypothetical protein